MLLYIFLQVPDFFFAKVVGIGLLGDLLELTEMLHDVFAGELLLEIQVAVIGVGVDEDFHDVGLTQQAQRDGKTLGRRLRPDREPRHQPGCFPAAFGIEIRDEILIWLVFEYRHESRAFAREN